MERPRWTILALGVLTAALMAWLWPIGVGGRLPVGGDVTQFQIGLMAFLHDSLRTGRLPLWNDLWGYGFPGVAESQMGAYYPPHLVLYGLFPTEVAYTASLVLHTLWAGLGTAWAARRFGASTTSAILAAFAWSASGFYVIHLPHQWGYTVGSWMPWAWGLAWPLARGVGRPREALGLAAALAVQTLPGHFQIAFITQLGVLVLAVWGLAARLHGSKGAVLGAVGIIAAVAVVPLLSAAQLLPTYRLARLAESDRDLAYLSGFAASPLHLISYVAPMLFHDSPLWRPVAWDPFHTSPEEHLAYVGLVPLFLAAVAFVRGIRRDPTTRALTLLIVVTTWLSLGPYVPGFGLLIHLPGFSFFRAPARWAIATQLALVLLAARGFDGLRSGTWRKTGPGLVAFVLVSTTLMALVLGLFEHVLTVTGTPGDPGAVALYDRALKWLPWEGGPTLDGIMSAARRAPENPIVQHALIRRGPGPTRLTLERERFAIYRQELLPTVLLLVGLLALVPLARKPRWLAVGLVVLTVLDLLVLGHVLRPVETAPIRPLTEQSRVLGRLAAEPRGTRVLSELGNLPMVAGVATLPSYRTLDLPALENLTREALVQPGEFGTRFQPDLFRREIEAFRAIGATLRVGEPGRSSIDPAILATWPGTFGLVRDLALASWAYGDAFVSSRERWASTYTFWRPLDHPSRAWLIPTPTEANARSLREVAGDADLGQAILQVMADATPLVWRSPEPERVEVDIEASGPAYVLVTQLYHPDWDARWIGPDGATQPAKIVPLFANRHKGTKGGWQGVRVPGPGRWNLRLEYNGRFERWGLIVSGVAWGAWVMAYWYFGRRRTGTSEPGNEAPPPSS